MSVPLGMKQVLIEKFQQKYFTHLPDIIESKWVLSWDCSEARKPVSAHNEVGAEWNASGGGKFYGKTRKGHSTGVLNIGSYFFWEVPKLVIIRTRWDESYNRFWVSVGNSQTFIKAQALMGCLGLTCLSVEVISTSSNNLA